MNAPYNSIRTFFNPFPNPTTMRLNVYAIDDEPLALRVITTHVKQLPFLHLVGITTDPVAGLLRVKQGDIDLVFLDIQMAQLTGLQFLQLLGDQCRVILTTAYAHYALDGYEYAVADYLLKPISFERFLKAVQRIHKQLEQLAEQPSTPIPAVQPKCLFVKTDQRLVKVDYDAILYIEGGKDYTTIVTTTEKLLTVSSLTHLADSLPHPQFLRVHKSYIVALDKISVVERQRIYLDKAIIPIGDTYRAAFAKVVAG
ncbi:LytR/AlgR family response regulator transcription factor [Hymenobacter volaticus]|uniref:LytTR family DNA-binding domain-containing protein n=1 Tax=Hymenobacter volaticus TaxID=2932254 RepID=A0ABY4G1S2_9BACT|nr:LytTR family DNA-binding domain-containing protein [Hymenobacter volaticus]UOQ64776.1 LytTR family DNA-binding domain-containing protein [Hymenobacter volaticus]